ncbi:Serine/threonine protein kinase [Streptosporangium canum]|uniref:non-specific serine/threonine protein kinase n=2 Tax=Streptosporangium canum TaxID=324952 RepID=A0A1I4DXE1_9ACTN|nr:Serine/threonine protein kinase [Streptosporangium canum]
MTSAQPGHMVGGRYRLITELGSGGFGRVWRAHDETLHVEVAIKELRLLPGMSQAEQDKRLERTAREARNAVRLRTHENVLAIHDIVSDDGLPWIVMELIDGQSLAEHIETHGPLPVGKAAELATALLAALGAAHQAGIVHRDIKPANVMISADGRVLLTDFGIAIHTTDTTLTTTGMLIGSPEYMAPERLRGIDGLPASDLFSLGVTLYQAVEGASPFRRTTQPAALTAVILEEPPPPRRADRLAPLITRLLDKDPSSRPTVDQALSLLGEQQPGRDRVRNGTKILPPEEVPPQGWQHKGVAAMMAIIFVLGVVGLTDTGVAWNEFERMTDDDVEGIMWGAIVANLGLAGLLGAQVARFVPPVAGKTVAFIVGIVGLLLGGGVTALAFDGISVLSMALDLTDRDGEAWQLSLAVITIVMLITGGWAWESRKLRPSRRLRRRKTPSL